MLTALAGTLALTGCARIQSVVTPEPKPPQVVHRGTAPADELAASVIFKRVCANTAPSFRTAHNVLGEMPFTHVEDSGLYVHQTLDLSVNVAPGVCAMSFRSDADPVRLAQTLATAGTFDTGGTALVRDFSTGGAMAKGPKRTTFTFLNEGQKAGHAMYRAALMAP